MKNCVTMDGFGISFVLWFLLSVVEALPCTNREGVYHHGKMSYTGVVLKRVNGTGPEMCLNICMQTGGCSHINYNSCELECDLMSGDSVPTELDFTSVISMTYVTLTQDIQVSVLEDAIINIYT